MRKDIIGWVVLLIALIPFNYVYFHIDDVDFPNWGKWVSFLATLLLGYIGYNMIGSYKEKHKKSHH